MGRSSDLGTQHLATGREMRHGVSQRTYYVGAEYIDTGDRLLVEDGGEISLYSVDLRLAQHWYAAAWRGDRLDLSLFEDRRLDWGMDPTQAEVIKESGLVLARCVRHGKGKPIVDEYNGHPIYGSGVEIMIGEVFEAALGHLIEDVTGIAGLTISPMHSGYAIHEGRPVGSVETVAETVRRERSPLGPLAPDGTVTILFSDIENSSVLNNKLGDTAWMKVLRRHNEIIRREVAHNEGYEVKTIGDAFMVVFQSAKRALLCAIGIQRAFSREATRSKEPITVRLGLHVGEVVREADDFYGAHITLAARIAAESVGGEILVSSLLREVLATSREFIFEVKPARTLKGFDGDHVLFSVRVAE